MSDTSFSLYLSILHTFYEESRIRLFVLFIPKLVLIDTLIYLALLMIDMDIFLESASTQLKSEQNYYKKLPHRQGLNMIDICLLFAVRSKKSDSIW